MTTEVADKVEQGRQLVDSLTDDELNELVDHIRAAYKVRAQRRNLEARLKLRVGMRVRIVGKTKPQYLQGLAGTIVETKSGGASHRVLIELDCGPTGKFRSGRVLIAPGRLEVIE